MSSAETPARLEARGIVKRFQGAVALRGVDFTLLRGEVHGLVGENGAGKSTLIKILTGAQPQDEGEITYEGQTVKFASPNEAQRIGIKAIYQEINLIPTLNAAENIFAGNEPINRLGLVDWRRMQDATMDLLKSYQINIDIKRPVRELGLASQQMVAIVRALSQNGRVIVMDEPTSSLTHREVDQLLQAITHISRNDVSIIYISHRLDELFRITDRVTVLRDGQHILTKPVKTLTRSNLVEAMLGHGNLRQYPADRKAETAQPGTGLSARNMASGTRVTDVSLDVHPGQIVGLAGLQGSGRTETMRALFGADVRSSGSISLDATPLEATTPQKSLARGLAYLPEDRKADGIIPDLSLRDNLTLILLPRLSRFGIVSRKRERDLVDGFIKRLGIRAASAEIPIRDLSGGNQQKVLIARLLCADPRYLMLDDPMRGIDIGAKAEIEHLITDLSAGGLGVLVTSSELEEVIGLADKVSIIREGATTASLDRQSATFNSVAEAIAAGPATQDACE